MGSCRKTQSLGCAMKMYTFWVENRTKTGKCTWQINIIQALRCTGKYGLKTPTIWKQFCPVAGNARRSTRTGHWRKNVT
ncbi:Hypothetical predicted protein [Podarcis lilfordi]|uniref:Uncharacterized protein n=1 Tax=Podarcis lilfordi TaxID=74358 RepID=A0AA35L3M4_9SAUR|nr:Hypothetical predicted protein [Podarcis lilfordi]